MKKIRVGLIGVGEWARYGHIPVLRELPHFEVTALSSRSAQRAKDLAQELGVPHGLHDAQALVQHPEVDLVAVLNQAPQHYEAARLALEAGKDVYCEWPLTSRFQDTLDLEKHAREAGVRTLVGLQRRFAPSVRYLRELLEDGYVGSIRSIRMHVSDAHFQGVRPDVLGFTIPVENFSSVFSIYGGHFLDLLGQIVGPLQQLQAVALNDFPEVRLRESGRILSTTAIDQMFLIGSLASGVPVSFHVEGGKRNGFGVQLDITGRDGDLRLSNHNSFNSPADHMLEGAQGQGGTLQKITVPSSYYAFSGSSLDASCLDLAYLYADFAAGRPTPDFSDALVLHSLLKDILKAAQQGSAVEVCRASS